MRDGCRPPWRQGAQFSSFIPGTRSLAFSFAAAYLGSLQTPPSPSCAPRCTSTYSLCTVRFNDARIEFGHLGNVCLRCPQPLPPLPRLLLLLLLSIACPFALAQTHSKSACLAPRIPTTHPLRKFAPCVSSSVRRRVHDATTLTRPAAADSSPTPPPVNMHLVVGAVFCGPSTAAWRNHKDEDDGICRGRCSSSRRRSQCSLHCSPDHFPKRQQRYVKLIAHVETGPYESLFYPKTLIGVKEDNCESPSRSHS